MPARCRCLPLLKRGVMDAAFVANRTLIAILSSSEDIQHPDDAVFFFVTVLFVHVALHPYSLT